ncbi:SprB repeat-containing protein [Hymenobacter algoricola]|uniref:SprB repeat-containing protein n=1 Tax=Hymenobacter algoricola TaxID=486267 RepID=A0ABP7NU80_9BACT
MASLFLYYESDGQRYNDGSEDYAQFSGILFQFNPLTRQVESEEVYARQYLTPVIGPPPVDINLPTDVELGRYVDGPLRTIYFHDGAGGLAFALDTLTITAQVVSARCHGSSTGSITLTVDGLPGPYSYSWADGPTTTTRDNLPAGSYPVSVTSTDTGAVATAVILVGQNSRIDVLVRTTDDSIALEVSGGVGPYTFLWDDGPTTATRLGLAPGFYACIVTDFLGCQAVTVTHEIEAYRYYFSQNPIQLFRDAGPAYRADPTTKPNLSFRCEVYVEPEYLSGEFVLVGTVLEQPADRAGRTTFQVQQLLDSFLSYHVPAVGQRTITRADSLFRRFTLKHAEVFGTPPLPGPITPMSENYVLKGGLDFYEQGVSTFLQGYQPAVLPFLTWQPNNKVVALDQPEFLYHQVLTAGVTEFQLRVVVRYTDGTTQARVVASQAGVLRYEVYCLPAGFAQLGLADAPGKQVVSWQVFVTDPDGVLLSEKRHYLLDRRPLRRHYLLFNTSLGGMATFAASGDAEYDVEVSGEEMERSLPLGYDPLQGDTAVQQRQLRPVLKVASGLQLDRAMLLHLQELLLSTRVLLLNGPRWLAGHLKTSRTPLTGDAAKLRTLELDFYLPRQQLFTPLLPVLPAGLPVPAVGPDAGALC